MVQVIEILPCGGQTPLLQLTHVNTMAADD